MTDRRTNRQTLSDRQWVTADDDDISLLVKQQMANANVEKERNHKKTTHTLKLTITKNEIGLSIGE